MKDIQHLLITLSAIVLTVTISALISLKIIKSNNASSTAAVYQSIVDLFTSSTTAPFREFRDNSSDYNFINPLLYIETDQRLFPELDVLDRSISVYVNAKKKDNVVNSVSTYFRYMNTGRWTGINEDETYEPSSMLKVAVMMAYVRKAMNKASASDTTVKEELSKKLYYPGSDETGQYYKATAYLQPGYYSIQDLINDMIINSDNVALNVLLEDNTKEYDQVYQDFRLPAIPDGGPTDFMSAKSYSVIFRTLYNATYLPWLESEQALQLLALTTFNDGLVAGVPQGTVVSHKFGEHTYLDSDGNLLYRELHDCGIVYYPKHPYLLCVMTKGQDFPNLASVISDISKMAYKYVDNQFSRPTGT